MPLEPGGWVPTLLYVALPGAPAPMAEPLLSRSGRPHHQVLDGPGCAGHLPQHLLLHGDDLGKPELLALHRLPQDLPLSV